MTITDRFPVPSGAFAVRAGLGAVWITYFNDVHVLRVNPTDGAIEAAIPVGAKPAFLDIGGGSVWVMASVDGALCRIDPKSNRVLSRTVPDPGGGYGDLTVGNGFVWWRGVEALATQVDQRSGMVARRVGRPFSDDAARRALDPISRRSRRDMRLSPHRQRTPSHSHEGKIIKSAWSKLSSWDRSLLGLSVNRFLRWPR